MYLDYLPVLLSREMVIPTSQPGSLAHPVGIEGTQWAEGREAISKRKLGLLYSVKKAERMPSHQKP